MMFLMPEMQTPEELQAMAEYFQRPVELFRSAEFNPDQPRDEHGQWTDGGGVITDSYGIPTVFYHQTSQEAAKAIMREGFRLDTGKARLSDDRVPDGVFFKPDTTDVGLGDSTPVQVSVNLSMKHPLEVSTPEDLKADVSREVPEYWKLTQEADAHDRHYNAAVEATWDEIKAIEEKHPQDAPRTRRKDSPEVQAILKKQDDLIAEWTSKNNAIYAKQRALITQYVRDKGHDGVVIENDRGSFGRKTKTIIALSPKQVKVLSIGKFRTSEGTTGGVVQLFDPSFFASDVLRKAILKRRSGLRSAEFNEDEHPRDEKGRWTDGTAGLSLANRDENSTVIPDILTSEKKFPHTGLLLKRDSQGQSAEYYAGGAVDGLVVRSKVPNTSSISASFDDNTYTELKGIRQVKLADLETAPYASKDDNARVTALADAIKQSREISPVIVVHRPSTNETYALEGKHRVRALHALGKTTVPAVVVVDHS